MVQLEKKHKLHEKGHPPKVRRVMMPRPSSARSRTNWLLPPAPIHPTLPRPGPNTKTNELNTPELQASNATSGTVRSNARPKEKGKAARTKSEACHDAEAVPKPHKLAVPARQLEEGEDGAAQQQEDVHQEHGEVQKLPGCDDKHLFGGGQEGGARLGSGGDVGAGRVRVRGWGKMGSGGCVHSGSAEN